MDEVPKPCSEEQKQPLPCESKEKALIEQQEPKHDQPAVESTTEKEVESGSSSSESTPSEQDDGEEFFVIKSVKQWDPRPAWLRDTEKSLSEFTTKFEELKSERQLLDKGLQQFNENQRLWAHRALQLPTFNKQEYFRNLKHQERHSLLQELHPSLLLLVFGFCHEDIYLQVLRMKRVCSSFRELASEQIIYRYCIDYYLGENYSAVLLSQNKSLQAELANWCRGYSDCKKAILYYKSLQYSKEIAQNSFRIDITRALRFINDCHELVLKEQKFDVEYFNLLNEFLLSNQAVMALTNLSIAGVQILRSVAVKALTNHMAFNSKLSRTFVSKAELNKSIQETEQPRVRLSLIVNTKLQEVMRDYRYQLTLFAFDFKQSHEELFQEKCDALWLSTEGMENSQVLQRVKLEKHPEHPNMLTIDSTYLSISLDRRDKSLQCRVSHKQHQHVLAGEVYLCLTAKGIQHCFVFSSAGFILILRFLS